MSNVKSVSGPAFCFSQAKTGSARSGIKAKDAKITNLSKQDIVPKELNFFRRDL
jgi:hypothetical protein